MRNDRHLAIQLRRKGLSYNEIRKELGIPKSTMHYWFRNLKWSQQIKKELTKKAQRFIAKQIKAMARANKARWEAWRKQHQESARKEFPLLKSNPLFVAGVMLYWGEGDSKLKNGKVELVNTDPRMIALFVKFLHKVVKVPKDKIFAWMTLYPDLAENKCKLFWSKSIGISSTRFQKTQFIRGRHPTKKVEYGMCAVQVNSRGLKEKIFIWIDLLSRYMRV